MEYVRKRTHGVASLLGKDLREGDHVRIVAELFREVDHGVGRVLLVAGARGGEEGRGGVYCDRVALFAAACGVLWGVRLDVRYLGSGRREIGREGERGRTQASSQGVTESMVVCAMRLT